MANGVSQHIEAAGVSVSNSQGRPTTGQTQRLKLWPDSRDNAMKTTEMMGKHTTRGYQTATGQLAPGSRIRFELAGGMAVGAFQAIGSIDRHNDVTWR